MTDLVAITLLMLVPFFLAFLTMVLSAEKRGDARVLPDHFVPGWDERRHTSQV